MADLNALIARLEDDPILAVLAIRDPKHPEFMADQALVAAVEQRTGSPRVVFADALAFAEGFAAAVATLKAVAGEKTDD